MIFRKISVKTAFVAILLISPFIFSESNDPFTGSVKVEAGENAVNWEGTIFGEVELQEKKEKAPSSEEPVEENKQKEKTVKKERKSEREVADDENSSTENDKTTINEKNDKDPENKEEYGKNSPEWGRYYGENIEIKDKKKAEYAKIVKDTAAGEVSGIVEEEPFMFPIDLLLWSQGGDGYNAMINTGVKVSYWNVYSILSVGTDFSAMLNRPVSLGVLAGGFYTISDFSITADLGYEKVWDFGDNAAINDYALGLRAGLSYSVLSWLAISAGAGVNYSVFKDSKFEDGKFIPMFFGGFEFNLIK